VSKITAYTALTTGFSTSDVLPIVDVSDTSMAASGTTKKITVANLAEALDNDTDTNIAGLGAQASGTVGQVADAGHVHPAPTWVPADNGLLTANGPLPAVGGGVVTTAGTLYLQKIWIRQPFTATNLWLQNATVGVGASTHSFIGIWSSAGALLTGSADIGANFTGSAGPVSSAWTTPQALTVAMGFVWVGWIFNLATTQPAIRTQSVGSSALQNTNLTAANYTTAANGTGLTALASITPSANTNTGATAYWAGIS
jgi:hypothetical protein